MRRPRTVARWVLVAFLTMSVETVADSLEAAENALLTGDYGQAASLLSAALEDDHRNLNARLLTLTLANITGDKVLFKRQVDFFLTSNARAKPKAMPWH
jgi:hypothetical protein